MPLPVDTLLHGLSSLCHLLLVVAVSVAWARSDGNTSKVRRKRPIGSFMLARATIFSIALLGTLSFLSCVYGYFWVLQRRWPLDLPESLMLFDLLGRAIAWFLVAGYLQNAFFSSDGTVCPVFLKVWWCFFLVLAASFLSVDGFLYAKHGTLEINRLVLDLGSFLVGAFLAFVGLLGKMTAEMVAGKDDNSDMLENLLDESEKKSSEPISGISGAGFLSLLTFSWLNPLFKLGHKNRINMEDVPALDQSDCIGVVYPSFKDNLESFLPDSRDGRSGTHTIPILKALLCIAWKHIIFTGFCAVVHTLAAYVGPYMINNLVQYMSGTRRVKNEGYMMVSTFISAKILECLTQRHWSFRLQQISIRVRAALVAVIYQKGLTVSNSSRQGYTSGEIINLMAVDAERISSFTWYLHDLWMIPMQVILAFIILYINLGLASIAALLCTCLVMFANYPIGKLEERYQEQMMKAKDARMKATTEILKNMRILKLQAWELKFLSKIMDLREKETNWLNKFLYTSAVASFAFWGAPIFVSVVSFGTCILFGIPLESGKIISSLATIGILQYPIYGLPDTISMIIQTKVSLDRISAFLSLEDLDLNMVERLPKGTSDVSIDVRNASFSWNPSSQDATLKDLNFHVLHGMKVAVCGIVGSGKSSLLSSLLGELSKLSGSVRLCGKIAYVPQAPWIQGGTVEDNILFGKEMDREKYEKILEACSLKKDMEILPFGDQTVIGERGINLSGGQKQRIQIARAFYDDADIYLLDDPFSAVDAHTRTHIFKECLLGLLASKTVLYVTHQIEFLPSADLILVVKHGRIAQIGKYSDILNCGADLSDLVDAHRKALRRFTNMENAGFDHGEVSEDVQVDMTSDIIVQQEERESGKENSCHATVGHQRQIIEEEEREKGRTGFRLYWEYVSTPYKGALVVPIVISKILFLGLQISSNYWIAVAAPVSRESAPLVDPFTLIGVYTALSFACSICVLVRAVLVVTVGYKTAIVLFNKMHMCIFRAPMSFFDSTPTGRIINRVSTDQNELDTSFFFQLSSFAFSVLQLLGIVAVISQVAWQVFIIFIPVFAACIWYQNYYITTARELSRLIGVHKAPVIQNFAETLSGSSTIRGFNQELRFLNTNFHLSDAYSRLKFYSAAAMEWLGFRVDILSSMTFSFALVFLISLPMGTIDAGIAGLAISYGLNLNMMQSWIVWLLCNLENKVISVERILQYTCIPSEPPLTVESPKSDSNWPSKGHVDICDLQVRYAPHMPFVLKGITCTFPGGRKTGIVGRTGSGKSTLIQSLFRIVDPTVGYILIDGMNISDIGLHDLRSKLSIIPQEPTMFEGSVRSNLDPLQEYTDEQIWEVLDKCQLGEEVRTNQGKLDSTVNENGENWSMGQRQLICLARVLLKKSRILVLDEATASVDTVSDNLMQKTIREQFSDSTVVVIAHRVTSVLDSDVVCLLDNGMMPEFDSPEKLLADRSSMFSKLVADYTSSGMK